MEEKKSLIKDLIPFHPSQTKTDFINDNDGLSEFWDKCSSEIKEIQSSTYGSILYKLLQETDENKLASVIAESNKDNLEKLIAESKKREELKESNYEKEFPIYGIELKRQVELGVQRLLDTLLLLIAEHDCPGEITGLIKEGANVNVRTKDGNTPLRIAVKSGHSDVVEALIREAPGMEEKKSLIKDLILLHPSQTKTDFINDNAKLSQFWDKCSNEMKRMENYDENMFRLSQINKKGLSGVIKENNKAYFKGFDYENKFPVYGNYLKRKAKLGIRMLERKNDSTPAQSIKDKGTDSGAPSNSLENSNAEGMVDQTSLVKHNSR